MRRTIVSVAAITAIGAICLCYPGCSKKHQDGADSTNSNNDSLASDVEARNQDQPNGGDPSAAWVAKRARVKAALGALSKRTNDDPFVTIEDRTSGKWVQFIKGPGNAISVHLALKALDDEEAKRASRYFAGLGISLIDGEFPMYLGSFDHDHERAAKVAMEVFNTIYQLPRDFDMQIEAH